MTTTIASTSFSSNTSNSTKGVQSVRSVTRPVGAYYMNTYELRAVVTCSSFATFAVTSNQLDLTLIGP
jgi:hypothetical protein